MQPLINNAEGNAATNPSNPVESVQPEAAPAVRDPILVDTPRSQMMVSVEDLFRAGILVRIQGANEKSTKDHLIDIGKITGAILIAGSTAGLSYLGYQWIGGFFGKEE